jgi:uncharacterized protein
MRHRIEDGYREKLEALLARGRVRRLRAEWLLARARRLSRRQGIGLDRSLIETYERVRRAVDRRDEGSRAVIEAAAEQPHVALGPPPRFLCDASLGGLARWLRAAGYRADAASGQPAGDVMDDALGSGRVLVTSDHRLLERRAARSMSLVWVPSRLGPLEQLRMVLGDLRLPPREPLCMACGGELRSVAKKDVSDRIPPRTARWRDEYFLCSECGKLFWHGTHWERIRQRLEQASARIGR